MVRSTEDLKRILVTRLETKKLRIVILLVIDGL